MSTLEQNNKKKQSSAFVKATGGVLLFPQDRTLSYFQQHHFGF